MSEKCGSHEALNVKIDGLDRRVSNLEEKQEEAIETKTLMRVMMEDAKKRDTMFQKQTETLNNIQSSLKEINNSITSVNNRVEVVEITQKEMKENSSINLNKLKKDIIFKVIPSLITGVILAWLLVTFGLK